MAGAIVVGSLNSIQASLLGQPQVPTKLFFSRRLAIDARVSEKLRAKIWSDEFFEFSSLLSNPVLKIDTNYKLQEGKKKLIHYV